MNIAHIQRQARELIDKEIDRKGTEPASQPASQPDTRHFYLKTITTLACKCERNKTDKWDFNTGIQDNPLGFPKIYSNSFPFDHVTSL